MSRRRFTHGGRIDAREPLQHYADRPDVGRDQRDGLQIRTRATYHLSNTSSADPRVLDATDVALQLLGMLPDDGDDQRKD